MSHDNKEEPIIFQLDDYRDLTGSDIEDHQTKQITKSSSPKQSRVRKSTKAFNPPQTLLSKPQGNTRKPFTIKGFLIWLFFVFCTYQLAKVYWNWRQEVEFSAFVEDRNIIDIGLYLEQIKGFSFGSDFNYYDLQTEVILLELTGVKNVHYFIKPGTFISIQQANQRKKIRTDSLHHVQFVNETDIQFRGRDKWNKRVLMKDLRSGEKIRIKLSDVYLIEFENINIMPNNIEDFNENNTFVVSLPKYCIDEPALNQDLNFNNIPLVNFKNYFQK